VSTAEYFAGKEAAPRPLQSMLDLSRIKQSGFAPAPAAERLAAYVRALAG
jgi:hypothetical protein